MYLLNTLTREHAYDKLISLNLGNVNHGAITHVFGYLADIMTLVPLEDLLFFYQSFNKIGVSL